MGKIPELPEIVSIEAELNAVGSVKFLRVGGSIVTSEELAPFVVKALRKAQELSEERKNIVLISAATQVELSTEMLRWWHERNFRQVSSRR